MSQELCIFKRIEKKYLLTCEQKAGLLAHIGGQLEPDPHGRSTICSLYLDTPDHLLIRNSLDARSYKEKLRLRSYGVPQDDTRVFLEIKKKYKGVVYKRRAAMTLAQAETYLDCGVKPYESQIMAELDYAMRFYRYPKPAMLVAYEREAYFVRGLPNLRLTFDTGVRYRTARLLPPDGADGKQLLPDDAVLLEIKTDGAMPVSFARALGVCGILPASFSKYGTAYRDWQSRSEVNHSICKGVGQNVCNF